MAQPQSEVGSVRPQNPAFLPLSAASDAASGHEWTHGRNEMEYVELGLYASIQNVFMVIMAIPLK